MHFAQYCTKREHNSGVRESFNPGHANKMLDDMLQYSYGTRNTVVKVRIKRIV